MSVWSSGLLSNIGSRYISECYLSTQILIVILQCDYILFLNQPKLFAISLITSWYGVAIRVCICYRQSMK